MLKNVISPINKKKFIRKFFFFNMKKKKECMEKVNFFSILLKSPQFSNASKYINFFVKYFYIHFKYYLMKYKSYIFKEY